MSRYTNPRTIWPHGIQSLISFDIVCRKGVSETPTGFRPSVPVIIDYCLIVASHPPDGPSILRRCTVTHGQSTWQAKIPAMRSEEETEALQVNDQNERR